MPIALVLDLARRALTLALMLAGPLLLAALAVGLIVSVLQAVTSIQEQTLAFVPKLVVVGVVFLMLFTWMLQLTMQFTTELFVSLPTFVF